jgi:hypothetical protein
MLHTNAGCVVWQRWYRHANAFKQAGCPRREAASQHRWRGRRCDAVRIRRRDTNHVGRGAGGGTIAIGREPVLVHGQPAGNYSVELWSGNNGSVPTVVASAGNVYMPGSLQVDGNIAAKYQDVAEWVDASEPLAEGTIVTIDPGATNRVTPSGRSYDTRIAGAVSPTPGLILGEAGPGKALVAQSGRVRIKADATFGAIRPGDLLVTSPTKGHAMRPKGSKVRPGTVIGKALEALPSGRGEILALLTLQ